MAVQLDAFVRMATSAGILLDVDGTLSPIVERPQLARLAKGTDAVLSRLVERYRVVTVISGRTLEELRGLIDVPGARLVGSYGLAVGSVPAELAAAVRGVADHVEGAWVEPKGATIAVHYREAADMDVAGAALAERLGALATPAGMELITGKRVLELVPAGMPLKEGVVERILEDVELRAVLYAGDDVADIRAFAALDRALDDGRLELAVKVAVRGSETPEILLDAADILVEGPAALIELLSTL